MTRAKPTAGDYVLATKYADGDPGDQFAIGFLESERGGRYFVVDSEGKQFRANGFRRAQKISNRRGQWLVSKIPAIELSSRSLWWWVRRKMEP